MYDQDSLTEILCDIVVRSVPNLDRGWKWSAPNFSKDGQDMITLGSPTKHPGRIVLHCGVGVKETKTGTRILDVDDPRLRWASDHRAIIQFDDVAFVELSETWLTEILCDWVDIASKYPANT